MDCCWVSILAKVSKSDNVGRFDDLGGRSSKVSKYGDSDVGVAWRSSMKVNFGDCGELGGRSSNVSTCEGGDVDGVWKSSMGVNVGD